MGSVVEHVDFMWGQGVYLRHKVEQLGGHFGSLVAM